jgi:hypothetical protein
VEAVTAFGILQYTSDGVYQADIKLSGTAHRANVGLAVRELDVNNTLIISLCTGTGVNPIRLYKRDGGSFTSLVESATPALTPGNTYTLKVVLCGINIQIWLNGTKYLDYDLVGADQTHFLMGVGGGLWINTGGSDGTDDLGSRWDNYSFTPSLGGEAGAAVKLGALYMGGCYREVFTGRIDTLDWSQDPMQLTFSDQGCWLQDTQIESEQLFGTTGGQAVETAMQNIINTWPSGMGTPSLYVPVSPSWNIRTYTQQRNKIMDAIRDLALQIGWDVRYRYRATGDGGTPAVTSLTLYDPNRGNVTPVDSIAASEYTDVRALSFNIAGVRNATLLKYWPAGGTSGVTATATDAPSIAKYGRRYIELPSSKNIDSSTEANKFVNGGHQRSRGQRRGPSRSRCCTTGPYSFTICSHSSRTLVHYDQLTRTGPSVALSTGSRTVISPRPFRSVRSSHWGICGLAEAPHRPANRRHWQRGLRLDRH